MSDRERILNDELMNLKKSKFEEQFTSFLCGFIGGMFFVWAVWACIH